jgi:NAD(P)-dependent dehydrogenase (short-subunit alcohol dehydrogenase family)
MTSPDTREQCLAGQVALVTGGSRGIGRAIATLFARSGAKVMIASRRAEVLAATAAEIGAGVEWFAANASDGDAARACAQETVNRFGRLDILVNNAGTNAHFGPLITAEESQAVKTAAVNLVAPLMWIKYAWQVAMEQAGGTVINVASVGGLTVEPNIGFYNSTKAALIHLTRQLAGELAPRVRVNAVAPGLVRTDMARALWEHHEADVIGRTPMGRIGEVDDVAEAVLFLAGPRSTWITGHTLVVDGGVLARNALRPQPAGVPSSAEAH